MLNKLITAIFGSRNDRLVKKLAQKVQSINAMEPEFEALSDDELRQKTDEFRQRYKDGESLDDLLPEAFATAREAARRTVDMRPYDVQLIGAMVLNDGKIAEMKTGEGKTLMATLPVYLNSLSGEAVHVVTVNDYLAKRDAEWMAPVYAALGLTVGVSIPGMKPAAKRAAYAADVTYATNNELGFDYLRDNMAFSPDQRVQQRDPGFAIVDEVDSILIDEARTPLIISGPTEDTPELYVAINKLVPNLVPEKEEDDGGDFSIDEKQKQVYLTEPGMAKVEELMANAGMIEPDDSLYNANNLSLVHHLNASLRAHHLYHRDVDYLVKDGEVVIVDEFTGRTLSGRRWSDGLHQAVEAKEGVPIQKENQTLASITFQNYFRLYDKLSGMTGTADTEAYEFQTIYGLEVVVIPTNEPMIRDDRPDLVFLTQQEKYKAIIEDIRGCVEKGRPVLVGTTSIESSELISKALKKSNIGHEILNAKQHEREAHIVAEAGAPGSVTIATNMAGRGTDIVLGGSLEEKLAAVRDKNDGKVPEDQRQQLKSEWQQRHDAVIEAGGLHIIGTERHESRRIDNQLRGRSGRQGDPGSSRFYLSLEDPLMRIFAPDRMAGMMQKIGMKDEEAIEHPWVSRAIENAQRKVESHNFDIRKHLLEFDDVANEQRKVIYTQRRELMEEEDIGDAVQEIRAEVLQSIVNQYIPPGSIDEQWDIPGLQKILQGDFGFDTPLQQWMEEDSQLNEEALRDRIQQRVDQHFADKEEATGASVMRHFEKALMLNVLDQQWKDHLANMDYLRKYIQLRGYAQKKPIQEYKRESFEMFTDMLDRIEYETVRLLARVEVKAEEDVEAVEGQRKAPKEMNYEHAAADNIGNAQQAQPGGQPQQGGSQAPGQPGDEPFVREGRKIGRNESCPCGSGEKYKHCHGKLS